VVLGSRAIDVDLISRAFAKCSCGGGDTDAYAVIQYNGNAEVNALNNTIIRTNDLLVDTEQDVDADRDPDNRKGVFDGGSEREVGSTVRNRSIFFESDVFMVGEPNPVISIDNTGTITAKTDGIILKAFDPVSRTFGPVLDVGDTIAANNWIVVGDIAYDETIGQAVFRSDGLANAPASTIAGNSAVFHVQATWDSVDITNLSDRKLVINDITVLAVEAKPLVQVITDVIPIDGAGTPANGVSIGENSTSTFEFDIAQAFTETDIVIQTLGAEAPGADIVLDGVIDNPIGATTIRNQRGAIYADAGSRSPLNCQPGALDCGLGIESTGTGAGDFDIVATDNDREVIRSNNVVLDADNGSIGRRADTGTRVPIAVELIRFQNQDGDVVDFQIDVEASDDVVLDLTAHRRTDVGAASFDVSIGSITAGNDIDLAINDSLEGDNSPSVSIAVDVELFDPDAAIIEANELPGSDDYLTYFRPDGAGAPTVDAPAAFGTDGDEVDSNYTFTNLIAGDNIHVCHVATGEQPCSATSQTTIGFVAFTDGDSTSFAPPVEDDDQIPAGTPDVAQVYFATNGSITVTETIGDLNVGEISSSNGDVELTSPNAITDGNSEPTTDVIGQNITMTAGTAGVAGGVGSAADFLEIDVTALLGELTIIDTAAPTAGVYVTEVGGDLRIDQVFTLGDVSITTLQGSILDANGNDFDNVRGQAINLKATGGSIGTFNDHLDIDSSRNSPFVCTHPSCQDGAVGSDPGLEIASDDVALEADRSIYVDETDGYLRLLLATTLGVDANIELTVRETGATDEDLYLVKDGVAQFAEGVDRVVANGTVHAFDGRVTLNVGDDVATHSNSQILAKGDVDLLVDQGFLDNAAAQVTLRGRLIAGCDPAGAGALLCNPSTGPPVQLFTVQTGDQSDRIQFGDETGLPDGGASRTNHGDPGYVFIGSKTQVNAGFGEDEFVLLYLQTADVTTSPANVSKAGHSITLDGQGDNDTYEIFTTGSETDSESARNYVINVLDTGNATFDTLTVHGLDSTDTPDVVVARLITCIDTIDGDCNPLNTEAATDPGLIAVVHGNPDDYRHPVGVQNSLTQRINYDTGVSAATIELADGDDHFFSDDTSTRFTVNGGAGDDNFQVGQLYGLNRLSPNVLASDQFPTLTPTTRGWLSPGVSALMTINGGVGNDETLIYSNQAQVNVNGGAGDDLTTLRAFAISQTNGAGDTILGTPDVASPIVGGVAGGTGDEVQYNLNQIVLVGGGSGFDKFVTLGTEFGDDFALTAPPGLVPGVEITGAGLYADLFDFEINEIDGLEGDDEFFVRSTPANVATRVIGGLGSDTFSITGDVVDDIITTFVPGSVIDPQPVTQITESLEGPVALEGGETGADRELLNGVMLPGEIDGPLLPIYDTPAESRQIDLVGIYNAADTDDTTGVLTETALNGFDLPAELDFGVAAVGNPFGEAQVFDGGITFGTIEFDGTDFSTDPVESTIEVLNLFLGQGDDRLDIQGTLQADLDAEATAAEIFKNGIGITAAGMTLTGTDWATEGFRVGQLVHIDDGDQSDDGALASWRVVAIAGNTMTLAGDPLPAIDNDSRIFVAGRHGALTVVHGGGGSDTIVVCNTDVGAAVPCGDVGGPDSPLVVYGDTSQDGTWYDGAAGVASGFDFGPKPFDPFAALGLADANNEDDEWFVGLADTFNGDFGDDVIDARGLFVGNDLPSVGITAYGGPGNDTIYGSQTGDHLAGGSGDDEIHGGRGGDHIYGDSGFNVNVFTRELDIVSINTSATANADTLTPGNDELFGEGDGAIAGSAADDFDDFIFGDFGVVNHDTEDPHTPFAQLQKIQTTGRVVLAQTQVPGAGGDDTIIDDLGADTVFGGFGNDRIETGADDDIIIGDSGIVVFALEGADDDSVANVVASTDSTLGGDDVILMGADDDVVIAGFGRDLVGYVPIGDPLSNPANNVNANGGPAEPTQIDEGDTSRDIVIGDNGLLAFDTSTGTKLITRAVTGDVSVTLTQNQPPTFDVGVPVAGGDDFIFTDEGDDIVFGASGDDWIDTGVSGDDLVVGDHGLATFAVSPVGAPTTSLPISVASTNPTIGGDDVLLTRQGDDIVIGGVGADLVNYVPVNAVASDPASAGRQRSRELRHLYLRATTDSHHNDRCHKRWRPG